MDDKIIVFELIKSRMLDKIKQTIATASEAVKEKVQETATNLSDATREKAANISEVVKEKVQETTNNLTGAAKEQAQNLTEAVREKTHALTDAVKEKTVGLIDDWLKIFPNLEAYGLIITSFGINMSISPTLEVELRGEAEDYSVEQLDKMLEDAKGNTALTTVFRTIRTTYEWHSRTGSECYFDKIYLKLSIGISPQVMVYLGEPKLM